MQNLVIDYISKFYIATAVSFWQILHIVTGTVILYPLARWLELPTHVVILYRVTCHNNDKANNDFLI